MRDLARVTDQIAADMASRAGEMLHRLSPEGRRIRQRQRDRRRKALARIFRRMVLALFAVLIVAVGWGFVVGPLGLTGIMVAAIALFMAFAAILSVSATREPTPAALAASDLPLLPQRTEQWLEKQRPMLPAPAARLVDGIGLKLEALTPQLATIDPQDPVAAQLRKLLGTELPELVDGYRRVPDTLRREARDGPSPDRQLLDGLRVVDEQLRQATEQLASGDLYKLATQGRYLELKYRNGDSLEGPQ